MFKRLVKRVKAWEARVHASFQHGIDTPEELRRVEGYMYWLDHGFLRALWHNEEEIGPGVWRANQPDHKRLQAFKERGGKTVLTLRGPAPYPYTVLETAQCAELGLDLKVMQLWAKVAPSREVMLDLIHALETFERPMLVHCKSGADRTGLAAAVYRLHIEKRSVADARRQLSLRYLHLSHTDTGVLDYILDVYEARLADGDIAFKTWIETEYDGQAIQTSFKNRKSR